MKYKYEIFEIVGIGNIETQTKNKELQMTI